MRVSQVLVPLAALGIVGCGASAPPPPVQPKPRPAQVAAAAAEPAPSAPVRPKSRVSISGLEGTLSAYDVRDTMERRMEALAGCQHERVRRVRPLAGEVQLALHVLRDGTVSQVDVVRSDIGDIDTEQCIAQVAKDTKFPRPNGGEADVNWSMALDPFRTSPAEVWEAAALAEQMELFLPDTSANCEMTPRSPELIITAYVARSGKVLAAGASSRARGAAALMECVARDVQTWRVPSAKQVAKVSFEARYRRPITEAQKKAIQRKFAKRREAERRQLKAEARRKRRRGR